MAIASLWRQVVLSAEALVEELLFPIPKRAMQNCNCFCCTIGHRVGFSMREFEISLEEYAVKDVHSIWI